MDSINPNRPEPIAAPLSRDSRVTPQLIRRLVALRQQSERELGMALCKLLIRHGSPAAFQNRLLLLQALETVEQLLGHPLSPREAELERETIRQIWAAIRERRPGDYPALAEALSD